MESGFKRLGLGDMSEYPEPVDGRYDFSYFKREDLMDAIYARGSARSVGYYVDTKGHKYYPPIPNPFLLGDTVLTDIPIGSTYMNSRMVTLEEWGSIGVINVIDMNAVELAPEIKKRYCPKYNLLPESNIIDLYNDIVYPKLDYVNGVRNMTVTDYSTSLVTEHFHILLNNFIDFPRHIDTVVLFNNMKHTRHTVY